MKNCPCHSGKEYAKCCRPFHQGNLPETALELMRSRYSAYAINLPDYIIATTHPEHPQYEQDKATWRRTIAQFSRATQFQDLKILEEQTEGEEATITFSVTLSQGGKDVSFQEKSHFAKTNGKWLYKNGKILNKPD